jgi:tetratricopeptide (TPR) repeat protein
LRSSLTTRKPINYIGFSYADKNQNLGDAEKYVETALKLDPNNAYYLDSLGWVFYRQNRFAEAKEICSIRPSNYCRRKKKKTTRWFSTIWPRPISN